MKVIVGKKVYQMSKNKAMNLLRLASEQVPRGVYALEKDNVIEMRNDKCSSITQVKNLKRQFRIKQKRKSPERDLRVEALD